MKGIIHTHVCACEILGPNMRRVGNGMAVNVENQDFPHGKFVQLPKFADLGRLERYLWTS